MEMVVLTAELRELSSHGKLNSTRKGGWIPAVLYGSEKSRSSNGKQKNALLKVNEKAFLKTVGTNKRSNVVLELKWGDQTAHVVIKEIQRDILTRQVIHIDFQRISMTEKIEVMVPIRIVGEAPGVKLSGGILEHVTRELKILCLPKDIPSEIAADVSQLEIGQGLSVKDLKEIPGVRNLSDPNLLVVNIVAPTVLEEIAAPAAATTAEPEVIAKGKKPEEEAAAAAPASQTKTPEKGAAPQSKGTSSPAGTK